MRSNNASFLPTIDEIRGVVTDEITALGGDMSDLVSEGDCLFLRGVLPASAEIRVGDSVQAGVALRAVLGQVEVFPYTLREICTNGAIDATALSGRQLERIEAVEVGVVPYDATVILAEVREAVRACASPAMFDLNTQHMQAITNVDGSRGLRMLRLLARMHREDVTAFLPLIFGRFEASDDRSAFGLMNAVTSVARDTVDPAARWRLERVGGSIPAYLAPRVRIDSDAHSAAAAAAAELEIHV